jgi:hypothetical protein
MLNDLNADQELFAAVLGLAQARRDTLLSPVQLYKGVRQWVAVKSSTDTRTRWPKPQPCSSVCCKTDSYTPQSASLRL